MIIFSRFPDSSDGRSELSQTDSAHTCWISLSSSGSAGSTSTARARAFPPEDRHTWLSSVHACHKSCNFRFDEGNQVVDDRPVHNNSICLCFHTSCCLCQKSPLLLEGLDLPADFSRCLHVALGCPVLPQLLHFALRNRHLAFSCPALPQQAHVDINAPISIGVA